jgi:hypothetical protein
MSLIVNPASPAGDWAVSESGRGLGRCKVQADLLSLEAAPSNKDAVWLRAPATLSRAVGFPSGLSDVI